MTGTLIEKLEAASIGVIKSITIKSITIGHEKSPETQIQKCVPLESAIAIVRQHHPEPAGDVVERVAKAINDATVQGWHDIPDPMQNIATVRERQARAAIAAMSQGESPVTGGSTPHSPANTSEICVVDETAYSIAMSFISETILKAPQLSDQMKGDIINFADAAIKCYASVTKPMPVMASLGKCASAVKAVFDLSLVGPDSGFLAEDIAKAVLDAAGVKYEE